MQSSSPKGIPISLQCYKLRSRRENGSFSFAISCRGDSRTSKMFRWRIHTSRKQPTNIGLSCIADMGEELWMYSKIRSFLLTKKISNIFPTTSMKLKANWCNDKTHRNKCKCRYIIGGKKLCSAVYHGDSFDDEKYNKLISYVQTAISWLHVCDIKLFIHICSSKVWLYASTHKNYLILHQSELSLLQMN